MKKLLVVLLSVLCLFILANIRARASPVLSVDASLLTHDLRVDIDISGLRSGGLNTLLGAFDLTLNFDPGVVNFLPGSFAFGTGLGDSGDPLQTIVGDNVVSPGNLRFFEVSLLESSSTSCTFCTGPYLEDLQDDSFNLATMHFFVPIVSEDVLIRLTLPRDQAILSDANGNAITDFTIVNAEFLPEPASIFLLTVGLAGITFVRLGGFFSRRRGEIT